MIFTPTIQKQVGNTLSCIVEASGSAKGVETALEVIGKQGQLSLIGDYRSARGELRLESDDSWEMAMMGSNASTGAWGEAVRLAVAEHLPLERLISHAFPAASLRKRRACSQAQGVMMWSRS